MSPGQQHTIRQACLQDLPAIWELERRVWKGLAPSRCRLKRRFSRFPRGFLVAQVGGQLGGFCVGVRMRADARELVLDESFPPPHEPGGLNYGIFALTVNPLFRRKGIASSLVRQQLALASDLGCRKLQLIANAFSRPIFERQGFKVIEQPEPLFAGFPREMPDAALMEKAL